MPAPLRLATRGSPLARIQAEAVAARLDRTGPGPAPELVVVSTEGDRRTDRPITELAGQGVFCAEVQRAVLEGRADVAVHSAKDLPSATPEGLVLAAVPERADPRDVLVGATLEDLPPGAVVATGAPRRRAQLANLRPDLTFVELRGNMARRLAVVDQGGAHAVVAARAALLRLGWDDRAAQILDPVVLLPQMGQGALALECRADDEATAELLAGVDDDRAHRTLRAERALLGALGGSCRAPMAGLATVVAGGGLRLEGLVATGDGRIVVRAVREGDDPAALGQAVARALLTEGGGAGLEGWETAGAP